MEEGKDLVRVRKAVMLAIDNLPVNGPTPPHCIRFKNSYADRGSVIAVCNEATKSWLVKVAPTLELDDGCKLKAVEVKDLLEYKKVAAQIPGPPVESELIMKRLQRQNPDLATLRWRITERKEVEEKDVHLVLTLDTASLEILENKYAWRPAYGMGEAEFTLLPYKLTAEADESESAKKQNQRDSHVIWWPHRSPHMRTQENLNEKVQLSACDTVALHHKLNY